MQLLRGEGEARRLVGIVEDEHLLCEQLVVGLDELLFCDQRWIVVVVSS